MQFVIGAVFGFVAGLMLCALSNANALENSYKRGWEDAEDYINSPKGEFDD